LGDTASTSPLDVVGAFWRDYFDLNQFVSQMPG